MDRPVLAEPPASGQPVLPHDRHPDDRDVDRYRCGRLLADGARAVRPRLDFSVRRPCVRGKAAGVLPRLAVSPGRPQVVGGEDARTCLTKNSRTSSIDVARATPRATL